MGGSPDRTMIFGVFSVRQRVRNAFVGGVFKCYRSLLGRLVSRYRKLKRAIKQHLSPIEFGGMFGIKTVATETIRIILVSDSGRSRRVGIKKASGRESGTREGNHDGIECAACGERKQLGKERIV